MRCPSATTTDSWVGYFFEGQLQTEADVSRGTTSPLLYSLWNLRFSHGLLLLSAYMDADDLLLTDHMVKNP